MPRTQRIGTFDAKTGVDYGWLETDGTWTGIHSPSAGVFDYYSSGSKVGTVDSAGLLAVGLVDINGVADGLVIDADGDTTISAPTDDQLDFEVGGTDVAVMFPTGVQNRGVEAVTATTGGATTGLITAGSSSVTITCDTATKQVSLPAASVGDRVTLYIETTGCEIISAVAGDKINEVVVGATNELAMVAPSTIDFHYFAADNWSAKGWNTDGTALAALTPDAL